MYALFILKENISKINKTGILLATLGLISLLILGG
jgi:EamA domain-containing membrane protein RarD